MACKPPGNIVIEVLAARPSAGGFLQLTPEQVCNVIVPYMWHCNVALQHERPSVRGSLVPCTMSPPRRFQVAGSGTLKGVALRHVVRMH